MRHDARGKVYYMRARGCVYYNVVVTREINKKKKKIIKINKNENENCRLTDAVFIPYAFAVYAHVRAYR
jgi:hypothetical protein